VEPEYDFYPHWILGKQEIQGTKELLILNLSKLCVDSSFSIDTIYLYNSQTRSGLVNYRRSFSYDEYFRISSIIAEVQIDSNWLIHQITNISYNMTNKIEQINFIRYEERSDSLIIEYKYNDNGLLLEEKVIGKKRFDSTWSKMWLKTYQWIGSRLLSYDYIDIDKNFSRGPNRAEFLYNEQNLPIECVKYEFINNLLEKKYKHTWKYDVNDRLIKHNANEWKHADWFLAFNEVYEYDSCGRLIKELQTIFETQDSIFFTLINKYFYVVSENDDSVYIQNARNEFAADSSNGLEYNINVHNSNNLQVGYYIFSRSGNRSESRKVVIERDKYNNVILVKDNDPRQNKIEWEKSMKVIFRKKYN
jgi:hypothetical protein